MNIYIEDLRPDDEAAIEQVARLLMAGFTALPSAWHTLDAAREEVRESFEEGRISRVARAEDGAPTSGGTAVLGWIGGIPAYHGHVYELHPLVVSPAHQGQGIGRALVRDLEARVRERGAATIMLGTDDESGQTTLSGINLLPNVWEHVANIQNLRRHPYAFYQKLGYAIVGVIPDANGPGKPDILMAKSLVREEERAQA
jgi:aminoglycoside 6'-N-acetyltransferase I